MKELIGIPASPGIVIGKVLLFLDDNFVLPEYKISENQIDSELERLSKAIEKSRKELEKLRRHESKGMEMNSNQLIDVHLMMLQDPEFINQIRKSLQNDLVNIESVLSSCTALNVSMLEQTGNAYLKERASDINDVSMRIMRNLLSINRSFIDDLEQEVILVGKNILPSDTIAMNKRMVKGLAMDMGGRASHAAILARSFEIPAVFGIGSITKEVNNGDTIIIDGYLGKVIACPDEQTIAIYKNLIEQRMNHDIHLLSLAELPSETKDGKYLCLNGNIEVVEEVDSVLSHGADGIGLYRSEFLLMQPGMIENEEEQFKTYKALIEALGGKPVTIRTLDIGGDKAIPFLQDYHEENPILGWRSIRFCLSKTHIFKRQLRALLRASYYGALRIMFPMISGVQELEKALSIVDEVKEELRQSQIPFNDEIEIGIMIEVPSAAMTSDILAKRVDFFSIGTNDLVQFTLAVDRGNERVAYLYQNFHPGVLRLIKQTIDNAHCNNIPVSLCGEMGGDPLATVVLLGLGLDSYSMSSMMIPQIKQIIRSTSVYEAEQLVGTIMKYETPEKIEEYVRKWMNERFDFFSI